MTAPVVKSRVGKKLIEVALPLDAINKASAREKSIRHGHPSTLHLWWARRPLATARAVIFAQMVDDPSEYVDVLLSDPKRKRAAMRALKKRRAETAATAAGTPPHRRAEKPRFRPSRLARRPPRCRVNRPTSRRSATWRRSWSGIDCSGSLKSWSSGRTPPTRRCWNGRGPRSGRAGGGLVPRTRTTRAPGRFSTATSCPRFHDPFAGGGALPLEAQRLGLEAHASDLNPVAVLINKAMIEIPPKFAGKPPVNPEANKNEDLVAREWKGAQGLAEDVRYYGQWMRDEAEKRIGHLYPKIEVTPEMVRERPDLKAYEGRKLTVIAWLWARTVKSPNPAFADVDVPLASTFMLSTKKGKEAYVEPVIEGRGYQFLVRVGAPADADAAKAGTKLSRGANFRCLMSGTPIAANYIRSEGKAGHISTRLMAIVAEGDRGRVYLAPTQEHEERAGNAEPEWRPDVEFFPQALGFRVGNYGMSKWSDLFTARQLVALTTFSELAQQACERVQRDAVAAGLTDNDKLLHSGKTGATAYAEAVAVYLSFSIDRMAMTGNSLVRWNAVGEKAQHCFGRQALPMLWDFAEPNFLATATGSVSAAVFYSYDPLNWMDPHAIGTSKQEDAATQSLSGEKLISTDPPYYDNVGYADLSDFFYVWLRRTLRHVFPDLFATVAVPKTEELVATPFRHGSKGDAETFFLNGMGQAMRRIAEQAHSGFPVSIYYAFKQSEVPGRCWHCEHWLGNLP